MYELLDEMLDNGYPLATEANILKAGIYTKYLHDIFEKVNENVVETGISLEGIRSVS